MKKTFEIKNLDCAVCAGKVAAAINKLPEIDNAEIDFLTKKLSVEATTENWEKLMHKVIKTCHKIEPDCEIVMEESAHHHCHHNDLNKFFFIRIVITIVLGAFCFIADNETLKLIVALAAYFVIGYDVLWRAIRNIFRGQVFDENFLMTIATVGAFFIREYPEAIAVMLFYQIGEAFQEAAVDK
ncbi:MAG: heavy metal translocating P-type ATPase, partial [Spirochaetales bacterium]|nr:heavy metal translocating P-type ATPase [Spirochaetales bacterium]